jgi:hypothetical protein
MPAAYSPSQHRRGERKKRHNHQQQCVEQQHDPVGNADVVEHDVMVCPHLPDEQERQDIGKIGRPERAKPVQQLRIVRWRPDLQDEQGRGDGEDGIAEGDQPPGLAMHGRGVKPGFASMRSRHSERTHPRNHRSDPCPARR